MKIQRMQFSTLHAEKMGRQDTSLLGSHGSQESKRYLVVNSTKTFRTCLSGSSVSTHGALERCNNA